MRTYERTHPWLKFQADLHELSPSTWIALGECQSKCEHIARVPLRPSTAEELYKLFLAKGIAATTAIEGNTLTEDQVRRHLDGNLEVPPSLEYQKQEIDNVLAACNRILDDMATGGGEPLSVAGIQAHNREVLANLKLEEGVQPGQLRTHSVLVGKYRGAPAEDCDYLLDRLCQWLNGPDFRPQKGMDIAFATLKAILAHLYIAWIHPFGDGNGRTARLVEFEILIRSGVPAPAAHLPSNHYNQTRTEYYRQLDHAGRSGGEVTAFVAYAIQGFLDGLQNQLETIWSQQWDVAWRNYVHELFRDRGNPSQQRQRHLVLDLSRRQEPVPMAKLPEISPRLARAYALRTAKTLSRDVNALVRMGLLALTPKGYVAQRQSILAFLPPRAKPQA
ncbi:MAG: Fic family protein [Acidobacteria bacterium]|nr:Fic family protein [Acidobacteriota bacterium]